MTSIAYENLRKAQPELNLPRWVELTKNGKRRMLRHTAEQLNARALADKMSGLQPGISFNLKPRDYAQWHDKQTRMVRAPGPKMSY